MPDGAGLAALDTLCARVNAGRRLELPTAVGFCMLITRRCIDAVGWFDQGNFPRGYGEENDFSLRAIEQGFRNLLCADVYVAHQGGAFVFHHNDGAIRAILPDMIEAGIDVLNPVQWRCKGMAREGLKRDFGDRLVFHGAMDNQYTLPFGSVEEVRQEVDDNLRLLGAGGGYILAPCHNNQANTPVENVVAMYETGYAHGWT